MGRTHGNRPGFGDEIVERVCPGVRIEKGEVTASEIAAKKLAEKEAARAEAIRKGTVPDRTDPFMGNFNR